MALTTRDTAHAHTHILINSLFQLQSKEAHQTNMKIHLQNINITEIKGRDKILQTV